MNRADSQADIPYYFFRRSLRRMKSFLRGYQNKVCSAAVLPLFQLAMNELLKIFLWSSFLSSMLVNSLRSVRRLPGGLLKSAGPTTRRMASGTAGSSKRIPQWSSQSMRWRLGALAAFASSTTVSAAAAGVQQAPVEHFRLDYKPSDFFIPEIFLSFVLDASDTIVTATSQVSRSISPASKNADLVLDGEDLDIISVKIAGASLAPTAYSYEEGKLRIKSAALPSEGIFELETSVRVKPDKNLALSGLYKSGQSLLCTQCEAMGFRRIAFHLDRPDILSKYKVRLEADKGKFPVLLSNGNKIDGGDLAGGRHWTLWEDPFPKPSYLFALVAGDLGSVHGEYTTTR